MLDLRRGESNMNSPHSILIIDDDPNLLLGLERLLVRTGYSVQTANSGWSGLESILNHKPDLVISDVMMPPPNGLELQKILSQEVSTQTLPFIFLSGQNSPREIIQGIRNGADDYISKPFDPAFLLARVQSTLRRVDLSRQEGIQSQQRTVSLRNRSLSQQLEAIQEIGSKLRSGVPPDDLLLHAAKVFAIYHHPAALEIWVKEQNQGLAAISFSVGFLMNYNGEMVTPLRMESPIGEDYQWQSQEYHQVWPVLDGAPNPDLSTRPADPGGGEETFLKVFFIKKSDRPLIQADCIDPMYIQAFLSQVSIILEKKKELHQLENFQKLNEQTVENALEALSKAQELRDQETGDHCVRVAQMTLRFAIRMGISEPQLTHIRRGAILHDVGKIGVPDHILLKKGALTDSERAIIRKHPLFAYDLLSKFDFLKPALEIPLYHHERWDGQGYPRGIKGEEIPLAARLFSIVDVWDAMTHDRVYRRAIPQEEVAEYLRREAAKSFQTELVDQFLEMLHEDHFID